MVTGLSGISDDLDAALSNTGANAPVVIRLGELVARIEELEWAMLRRNQPSS